MLYSLALKMRYSHSDGLRSHCPWRSVPRDGHILRQFHRTSSRSSKHATERRSPRFALQNPSPRARHVVFARNGVSKSRSRCGFTSLPCDKPISGQLRSSVILVSISKRNTLQIHHNALSANVTFRLTPRTSPTPSLCTSRRKDRRRRASLKSYQRRGHLTVTKVGSHRLTLTHITLQNLSRSDASLDSRAIR